MKIVLCLGIVVAIFTLIALAALLVSMRAGWLSHEHSQTSRMKFEQWLDLYYLNPEDWYLEDAPNRYIIGKTYWNHYWAYIHFSFPDYIRYRLWRRNARRRENNSERDKRLKDVLEMAQSDIERLKAKADREMEEAKRQMEETSRRITNPITRPPTKDLGRTNHNGTASNLKEISQATDLWF